MAPAFSVQFLIYSVVMCNPTLSNQAVVDYIISNWDRFKVFTHDQGNNYSSLETYKTAMLNPITYGSASEFRCLRSVFLPFPDFS
ncbi:UNVERIFIED_CONTAM: hypothetical protein NCL1_42238 [Trichonephila clavipes]